MQRITVDVLASGQPRAYADTYRHVRVTMECFCAWLGDPKDPRSKWEPSLSWEKEGDVRQLLKHLRCGFTESTDYALGNVKLDWLKKVGEGVWEFHTTEPFCD